MLDLIYQGSPFFMGVLTLLLFALFIVSFRKGKIVLQPESDHSKDSLFHELKPIKAIGTLALVIGLLGQLIGLYGGFQAIEAANGVVSPAMLAGGVKVSIITTVYGLLIFLIGRLIHLYLSSKIN